MTALSIYVDPFTCTDPAMFNELIKFETQCICRSIKTTTSDEIKDHLRSTSHPELADQFDNAFMASS